MEKWHRDIDGDNGMHELENSERGRGDRLVIDGGDKNQGQGGEVRGE